MARWSEKIQRRPLWRSFENPAAKKITAVITQIARIGQVYSPLGATGERPRLSASQPSTDHASPARLTARMAQTSTTSVSKCWICPKFCGSPSR